MKIKIVGPEKDPVFQDIQRHFLQAIHELQVEATIDEVTQLSEMQDYPLLVYPAIFINDELCCQGKDMSLEKAKQCILQALEKGKKSFRPETDRSLRATGQCVMVIENCQIKDRTKARQLLKNLLNENL